MTRLLLCAAFLGCILLPAAHAKLAPGTVVDPELHAWFERQQSMAGGMCCSLADGHMLGDSEWRVTGDHYEVRIQGAWHSIPPDKLRDPKGGANPTGQAIIWFVEGQFGIRIYCFAPGQFY